MSQWIHDADWQTSSLGAVADWPSDLRVAVGLLLKMPTVALLLHGPQCIVLYNDACATFIGDLHPGLLGSRFADGWPALLNASGQAVIDALAGKADILTGAGLTITRAGVPERVAIDLSFIPVCPQAWKCAAVFVQITDRTPALLAEESLRRELAQMSSIFREAQVGMSELAPDGRFLRVNEALCNMLGRSRETMLNLGTADVTHPDDVAPSLSAVEQLMRTGIPASLDKRYLRPDGTAVPANSNLSRLDPAQPGGPFTLLAVTVDLTERTVARQALAENEARFRALAEASPVLIWQLDADGRTAYLNPKCYELFGNLITASGVAWESVLHPEDAELYFRTLADAQRQRIPFQRRVRIHTQRGQLRWLESYASPWFRDDRSYAGHVGISIDITETVTTQEQLMVTNDRLNLAIDGSGDGVWDWNIETDEIVYSRRLKEIIGFSDEDRFETHEAWVARIHREDIQQTTAALHACMDGRSPTYNAEYRMRCKDNRWKWILARAIVVARDEHGSPRRMTGTVTDISDERQSQEVIWLHANFDALTGMPNRRLFRDRLDHEVRTAHRNASLIALLFIDLDHFKETNDLLGHDAGDQLLAQAASRIVACVRESDTVARLGGDEFTAILTQLEAPYDAEHIARKINQALASPFSLGNEVLYLSASIGITLYPTDGSTPEELIRNADQAMYVAKNGGRNQFNYFTPKMQKRAQDRLRLIADLRGALAANELVVYYQPIVALRTGRVVKAEALLRWNHPRQGLLQPAEFIPFAEESGLISEIGDWVFQEAAACSQKWRAVLGDAFQISVNRSPTQFMSRTAGTDWPSYLAAHGMDGSTMSVEITEAVLLNASNRVTNQLLQYHAAGIQVAIDDFGTGYSSLAYLKKFEIDYLKIDQSFIHDMHVNESDRAIVRSVTAMAHELGLQVVAEGIETLQQTALLIEAGCDFGQGFYFSRPVPPAEFESLLQHTVFLNASPS